MLALARLTVLIIPFRSIAPLLGRHIGLDAFIPLTTDQKQKRAHLIGKTIRISAKYAPWDANCFAQAIVARILLKIYKIPYSIFFGLKPTSNDIGKMDAHAWTTSDRVAVTGGHGFDRFTVVATFTG